MTNSDLYWFLYKVWKASAVLSHSYHTQLTGQLAEDAHDSYQELDLAILDAVDCTCERLHGYAPIKHVETCIAARLFAEWRNYDDENE